MTTLKLTAKVFAIICLSTGIVGGGSIAIGSMVPYGSSVAQTEAPAWSAL